MISGCVPVVVTPFSEDRSIDLAALDKIVSAYVEQDVEALWVLGTGAEDMALPFAQRLEIVQHLAVHFGDKLQLLVGCSFFALAETLAFLDDIRELPLAGIHYMPYQPLIGLQQLRKNYLTIAERTDFPVWIYTSGNWTRNIPPDFIAEFVGDRRFAGCKYSTSNIVDMEKALRVQQEGFQILPAVVKQLLPSLSLGAQAYTTVEASIHLDRIRIIDRKFRAGDITGARVEQQNLNQLMEQLSTAAARENFLKTAEIKGILEQQGICARWMAPGFRDITDTEAEDLYRIYSSAR